MTALMEVQTTETGAEPKASTKILSWVFDKFVGGAVGQAGGFGMDQILFLIGLKEDPQITARLDKIQQGIDDILREVRAIRLQLNALVQQLKLSTQQIIIAIGESAIDDARATIDTHYGTASQLLEGASDAATITSLGEAVRLRLAHQDVDTKTFAQNVLGTWDIQRAVVKIAQVAGSKTSFTTEPLLKGWTRYMIEHNRTGMPARALTIYLTLESYFQQLLELQFKGIGLVAAAKCHDKPEAQAKPITEAFLADIAPHIKAETDLFVQCAGEIITAIFCDTNVRWLYSPGPVKSADVIVTIMQRANLLRSVVRAAVGLEPASLGGIHGAIIGRNVEKEFPETRTYAPKGFPGSAGDAIGPLEVPPGDAPIEWAPSYDKTYGHLRPKSKSGFWAFHYTWPWKKGAEPEAGKPLDPSFDGGLVPRWYSLDTLEAVDKRGDNTVLVANFCEMRFMRGAVFANPGEADAALVSVPATGTSNVNENRHGYRIDEVHGIHAMRADESYQRLLAKGTLEARMNYYQPQGHPVGYQLEFPLFRYKGEGGTLLLACERTLVLELLENVFPIRDRLSTMRMTPRGTFALSRSRKGRPATRIPLYDTNDGLTLWARFSPARSEEGKPFHTEVQLLDTGGGEDIYSLLLEFTIINDLAVPIHHLPEPPMWAKGRIKYDLSGLRIMWK